jgi:hypothetical protein
MHRILVACLLVMVACSGCCPGFGFDQPETQSLDPHPITLVLPAGFEPTRSGDRVVLTDVEDPRVVSVFSAAPGGDASTRSASEVLPGATFTVEWTRPFTYDGMTGTESRVVETAPEARVHWIGALDGPGGVLFIDMAADADVHFTPSGDDLWTQLRDSVRRVP